MIDKLLDLTLDEIKTGIKHEASGVKHTCLICSKEFEAGEVFEFNGKYYDAARAAEMHIEKKHGSMLETLMSFDKKYAGITDNQKELLLMMHDGMSDKIIAQKMGVAQPTVRHQRFVFRERAKQAKLYLAIYELAEKAASEKRARKSDELVEIHKGAKMIDDRYFITQTEEEKIIADTFESLEPLKLKFFSAKEKKKVVILRKIAAQFVQGRKYTEKEVNAILSDIWDDYATLRRYLIEYGFMQRTDGGGEYWLS